MIDHDVSSELMQRSDQGVCKSQQTPKRTSLRLGQFIWHGNESGTATTLFVN